MPHVIVKLWPGKSEQQKARLAEQITEDFRGAGLPLSTQSEFDHLMLTAHQRVRHSGDHD